jgi:type IV secretion system protein VirB9
MRHNNTTPGWQRIGKHRHAATVLVALACLTAGGCASEKPDIVVGPDTRLVPAHLQPNPTPPRVVRVKVPVFEPQLRPLPVDDARHQPKSDNVLDTIAKAAAKATRQPTPKGFIDAVEYYDYAPGVVYTAVTSPGFVTTIALQPGEQLESCAAGDTTRWIVQSVQAGSGTDRQSLILVKPRLPDLATNMVITTDRRIYQIDLRSVSVGVYQTMIAWHYPFGSLTIIENKLQRQEAGANAVLGRHLNLSQLNFNYLILKQKDKTPPWTPLRAFDDGQKTFIEFPPDLGVTAAPPLFVLGRNGRAQIVNYRIRGDYYIVDQLFNEAELRLGQNPQTIVRIQRAKPK